MNWLTIVAAAVSIAGVIPCQAQVRVVRSTGRTDALHSYVTRVPEIQGRGGQLTLTTLVQNGAVVKPGDLLADFDNTEELKQARDASAKYDDFVHQVEQKRAEQHNNAEKRNSDLIQAQADLKKAEIDVHKGPVLSDIEQQKNAIRLSDAQAHVASLMRSNKSHDQAEAAELRVLELKRDRQKLSLEREKANAARLIVRSPIAGMVALSNTWRGNSMGHAQEGDRLWTGQPLLRVFDPAKMIVLVAVAEPDGAVIRPGCKAKVRIDAFPDLSFDAHYDSASPVATGGIDSPVKTFTARFVIDQSDSHLLPDLSVAVDVEVKP